MNLLSPGRWLLLFAGMALLLLALKTAGIMVLFQYNANHLIHPSSVNPRLAVPVRAHAPVRVLRVQSRNLSLPLSV